jgi:hypothetical protein
VLVRGRSQFAFDVRSRLRSRCFSSGESKKNAAIFALTIQFKMDLPSVAAQFCQQISDGLVNHIAPAAKIEGDIRPHFAVFF